MSRKSSPWENSFQESFYSNFKLDLGQTNRFDTLPELVEEIYQKIYYYNNKRIHTELKMSPIQFKAQYYLQKNSSQAVDKSVQRMGYLAERIFDRLQKTKEFEKNESVFARCKDSDRQIVSREINTIQRGCLQLMNQW